MHIGGAGAASLLRVPLPITQTKLVSASRAIKGNSVNHSEPPFYKVRIILLPTPKVWDDD